jgi:hypothetical protein
MGITKKRKNIFVCISAFVLEKTKDVGHISIAMVVKVVLSNDLEK